MNSKLANETTKKLLLFNGPLILVYIMLKFVLVFVESEYLKVKTYIHGALWLFSAIFFVLCVVAIVLSLYKTFVVDLLLGKSYKYYSLPFKKSKIIFSRAVPAIIIESLIVILLFMAEKLYDLVYFFRYYSSRGIAVTGEYLADMAIEYIVWFICAFILFAACGFLILLAFVISRSFDPSKTVRNLVLAIIIEVLANCSVFIVIMNISNDLSMKYCNALEKYTVQTVEELYRSIGLLAYYDQIINSVMLLLLIIEIIGSIIVSKKLADKRLNVL